MEVDSWSLRCQGDNTVALGLVGTSAGLLPKKLDFFCREMGLNFLVEN